MRWGRTLLLGHLLVAGVPAESSAVDVVLGWELSPTWDSNIFRRSEDEEDDLSLRTGPLIEIEQHQGDLTGRFRWQTLWEGFLDNSEVNAFEHFSELVASWRAGGRTTIDLSNNLVRSDAATSQLVLQGGTPTNPGLPVNDLGTDSTLSNNAVLSATHLLSPRLRLQGSVSNSLVDFETDSQSDANSTRGAVELVRQLDERVGVGFGGAFTFQEFDDTAFAEGSESEVIELFGILDYQISPTLTMSLRLGPALNRPDSIEASRVVPSIPTDNGTVLDATRCPLRSDGTRVASVLCPAAPVRDPVSGDIIPGTLVLDTTRVPLVEASFLTGAPESDDTLTLFGLWSLVKQWDRSSAGLLISRRTSASSGTGTSTDLTVASANFGWEPARRWRLNANASWSLQTSASDFPLTEIVVTPQTLLFDDTGNPVDDPSLAVRQVENVAVASGVRVAGSTDNAFEQTTFQIQGRADHQFSRRLTGFFRLSWQRQEFSGDLQSDETTTLIRAIVGMTWKFDPIQL